MRGFSSEGGQGRLPGEAEQERRERRGFPGREQPVQRPRGGERSCEQQILVFSTLKSEK